MLFLGLRIIRTKLVQRALHTPHKSLAAFECSYRKNWCTNVIRAFLSIYFTIVRCPKYLCVQKWSLRKHLFNNLTNNICGHKNAIFDNMCAQFVSCSIPKIPASKKIFLFVICIWIPILLIQCTNYCFSGHRNFLHADIESHFGDRQDKKIAS